jgi:hypothetical protein
MTTATTLHCPSWCDAVHDNNPYQTHDRVVLGSYTGDMFACVALEADTDGAPTRIFLDVTSPEQTLSPEEAVKVAAAITEAVRLAGVTR